MGRSLKLRLLHSENYHFVLWEPTSVLSVPRYFLSKQDSTSFYTQSCTLTILKWLWVKNTDFPKTSDISDFSLRLFHIQLFGFDPYTNMETWIVKNPRFQIIWLFKFCLYIEFEKLDPRKFQDFKTSNFSNLLIHKYEKSDRCRPQIFWKCARKKNLHHTYASVITNLI